MSLGSFFLKCSPCTRVIVRYFAILLYSHCTGFSLEYSLNSLGASGFKIPLLEDVRFISNNIAAFSPVELGHSGLSNWMPQRDLTPLLSQFELSAFRMSLNVFFIPNHLTITLDDDLYGTRARDNQVKTISSRKADTEGHSADAIADAFFRITLAVRFRRRGHSQESNVECMFRAVMQSVGQLSPRGIIVTADRGYGRLSLLSQMLSLGFCSMFIFPEHLIRCHPFVGKSFLQYDRSDVEDQSIRDVDQAADDDSSDHIDSEAEPDEGVGEGTVVVVDRRRNFIIDDGPDTGSAAFVASRAMKGAGTQRVQVNAVAVREQGTSNFAKVIRFAYHLPTSIAAKLNHWVAVPHRRAMSSRALFTRRDSDGKVCMPADGCSLAQSRVERWVWDHCRILTVGQRCADWFVLRQFRLTGTLASKVLLAQNSIRDLLGLHRITDEPPRPSALLHDLISSWFSSKRSSEAMMRGTLNEDAVMTALASKSFVVGVFETGMVALSDAHWIACSPDGLALITIDGSDVFATVEIKTSVAQSSLDRTLPLSSADAVFCDFGDETFRRMIPVDHIGQVLMQVIVLQVSHAVYVAASETGIAFIVVARCPPELFAASERLLRETCSAVIEWLFVDPVNFPAFISTAHKSLINGRRPFIQAVNAYVEERGPFPPLKLFKHGSQMFYSRTKGGVDGSAQQRAILRSSTSSLKWQQKVVSQTLKTLAVNSFMAWRINQAATLLETQQSYGSLDKFRSSLNKVNLQGLVLSFISFFIHYDCVTMSIMFQIESFADFIGKSTRDMLAYADGLENSSPQRSNTSDHTSPNTVNIEPEEKRRLKSLAANRKRNRLQFFNQSDGVTLR